MYDVDDRSQSGLRARQGRNEGRKRGHGRDDHGEPAVDRSTPAGAADGAAEVFARLIDLADDRRRDSDLAGRASPPLEARMRGSSCFTLFTSTTDLT
jgi:hypothetical protein